MVELRSGPSGPSARRRTGRAGILPIAAAILALLGTGPAFAQVGPPAPSGNAAKSPAAAGAKDQAKTDDAEDEGVVTNFDDWSVRCIQPDGQLKRCVMSQVIVEKESQKPVVHMSAGFVPDSAVPVMQIAVPLGVYLPAGIALNVDEEQLVHRGFEVCSPSGCQLLVVLSGELLEKLKKGDKAEIAFQDAARQNVGVPASLKGFTAAYNALIK
ncbi:MAG: invasion associated locus B family protein [Alphaproteobacteria bacterium]|nr:invasion associated locus B family protein [Alphaproteobacteria bacterium]